MTTKQQVQKIVNGLLGHDDGVESGDDYHNECRQEADEATQQILDIIKAERIDELEDTLISGCWGKPMQQRENYIKKRINTLRGEVK